LTVGSGARESPVHINWQNSLLQRHSDGGCKFPGLADEVRYSIMPILIGEGIRFFEGLDQDVALHLAEVKAYTSGMVALRHEVKNGGANRRTHV
jgi:hypothetical protein